MTDLVIYQRHTYSMIVRSTAVDLWNYLQNERIQIITLYIISVFEFNIRMPRIYLPLILFSPPFVLNVISAFSVINNSVGRIYQTYTTYKRIACCPLSTVASAFYQHMCRTLAFPYKSLNQSRTGSVNENM